MGREVLIAGAGSAGKLDDEAFTHEVGAIWSLIRVYPMSGGKRGYVRNAVMTLAQAQTYDSQRRM